jgi:hypothetical protein
MFEAENNFVDLQGQSCDLSLRIVDRIMQTRSPLELILVLECHFTGSPEGRQQDHDQQQRGAGQ